MLDPHDPVFWVNIAFLLFIGLLVYYKVPGMVAKALDARADAIRNELDEARRLREEAQALLDDYKKRAREAEEEAKVIVDQAKHEAEALAEQTRQNLAESIARRSKLAEEKIARAEVQAIDEVRAAAVENALTAAEKVLRNRVTGEQSDRFVEEAIKDLKQNLN